MALLVHGLGAHSGWFEAFARQLKVRRIFAVSYDHVGFGKRRQEAFTSYTQWLDDLVRVFDYLKQTYTGKPVYVIGNSMGGLLSLVAAQYFQADGLVLLSPGFDGAPETFTWYYRAITILKAVVRPEMEVILPYDATLVTRDEGARAFINADEEGRFRVPGKYLLQLLHLSNAVKRTAHTVNAPVLMLTAGKDRIVHHKVNLRFFDKLTAPAKRHKHFADAWHDLMFDPQVDEVAEDVVEWMSQDGARQLTSGST